ncbi:MAG: hypothetical protein J5766_05070 [Clostridia bacterium]|nr:hypothetical protein [Clostridia bacterium]
MEIKIEDLVSSIKKDGIDAANTEAEKIIADAKEKAEKIIADAKEEQKKIKEQSEAEINVLRDSAKVAAMQAERDAVLLFKDAVKKEFEKLLEADIKKALDPKTLAELIKAALAGENAADYQAEISKAQEGIKGELAAELKDGLEIKITPDINSGFRLSAKDGSGYFDCSDEAIAEMLAPYFTEIEF